jgi:hypothetical protein
MSEANHLVARLGGFADRKADGQPGVESLGIGLRRLSDLTWGWKLRKNNQ